MVADLAASFQEAVVDCLVAKTLRAVEQNHAKVLCVGGGVAANGRLRERLTEEAARRDIALHIPPLRLCTDNAVMGAIAVERLKAGLVENLDLDIFPGLVPRSAVVMIRPVPGLPPGGTWPGCVPPAPGPGEVPVEPLWILKVVTAAHAGKHRHWRDAHVAPVGRHNTRHAQAGAAGQGDDHRLIADLLSHERQSEQVLPRAIQQRAAMLGLASEATCCARIAWFTCIWPSAALASCCSSSASTRRPPYMSKTTS